MKVLRSTVALSAIAAAMLSTNASAVNIANEGIGEVAISPFYTTREGWQSTINLINTQDRPLAVKVRFHEAMNSRDVLDFTVTLSAFDVFVGVVKEGASGQPVFVNLDQANTAGLKTCTVPNTLTASGEGIEVPLNPAGYTGLDAFGADNSDGGPTGVDRLREGYVEFIVMGFADQDHGINPAVSPISAVAIDSAGYAALPTIGAKRNFMGRAIEDHDCATVRSGFITTNILNTARQFGEPVSALKFNFTLINPARGTETGYQATTWANFYNPGNGSGNAQIPTLVRTEDNFNCDLHRGIERDTNRTSAPAGTNWCPNGASADDCLTGSFTTDPGVLNADVVDNVTNSGADAGTVESCRNLITAQQPDAFLEPTLNDVFPVVANFYDDVTDDPVNLEPRFSAYENDVAAINAVERFRGVEALSATIQRANVINDWSTNPTLGVKTDWILTQPTKGFYVDQGTGAQFAVIVDNVAVPTVGIKGRAETLLPLVGPNAVASYGATGVVPYPPYQARFARTNPADPNSAKACNDVGFALFDRAEQTVASAPEDEPVFSPALPEPTLTNSLCYEMTVMSFIDSAGANATALGTALNRLTVDTRSLATPSDFGWLLMTLDNFGSATATGDFGAAMPMFDIDANAAVIYRGLPVIGFNIRTRQFPARPDLSFSSSAEHAYVRSVNPEL